MLRVLRVVPLLLALTASPAVAGQLGQCQMAIIMHQFFSLSSKIALSNLQLAQLARMQCLEQHGLLECETQAEVVKEMEKLTQQETADLHSAKKRFYDLCQQ